MPSSRAWVSWSTGKDCALALHTARSTGDIEITGLLTVVDSAADRVLLHGVRRSLAQAQADALGLPLRPVEAPQPYDDATYGRRMADAIADATASGARYMIFGDLYLGSVRTYREQRLAATGITPLFPLWRRPTTKTATDIIECGIRAVITCVDPARVPAGLVSHWYNTDLLADLPAGLDPCGENGEFHTLVVDGPGFAHRLDVEIGDTVERDGLVFADVVPAGPPAPV